MLFLGFSRVGVGSGLVVILVRGGCACPAVPCRWSRFRAGRVRAWLWDVWVRRGLFGSWSVVVTASRADPCLLPVAIAVSSL